MKYTMQNTWFHGSELLRTVTEIHRKATTEHTHWLGHADCKYISVRIDQRTGHFCLQDSSGNKLSIAKVYEIFPALKDEGEIVPEDVIVAAGVRPYPE